MFEVIWQCERSANIHELLEVGAGWQGGWNGDGWEHGRGDFGGFRDVEEIRKVEVNEEERRFKDR